MKSVLVRFPASLKNLFLKVNTKAPVTVKQIPKMSNGFGACPKRKNEKKTTKNGLSVSSGPKTERSLRANAWTYKKKASMVIVREARSE